MHRSIAALPLLALSLSACSASTLFRANFDLDPVGGLPSTSPPGEPFGDEIWLATLVAGGSIPHPVTVVGGGAISGRSLRYGNLDIPSLVREVRFISRELDGSRDRYWAYWVGRLDDVAPTTSPLDIHFGNFTVGLALFRIHEGRLWVPRTSTLPPQWEPVGDMPPQVEHSVIVAIDNRAGTFDLTVFQRRNPIIDVDGRPLASRSLVTQRRLQIQLRFEGDDSSPASYVVDGVGISQVEPDVP